MKQPIKKNINLLQ